MRRRVLYILAGQAALFLAPTHALAQEQPVAEAPATEASAPPQQPKAAPSTEQASPVGQQEAPIVVENDLSEGLDDLSLVDLLQLDLKVATTKTDTTIQASPAA